MSEETDRGIGRRAVLCGCAGAAGAAVLAGCGAAGGATAAPADIRGRRLLPAADVPVGGGKLVSEAKVVVTQPSQGQFKAFSAVCPHQGCLTSKVAGGKIQCPCHGSEFGLADGAVGRGPAREALREYPVRVEGGTVVGI